MKDSLENGTGLPRLDKIIKFLLADKPVDFFKTGYINDLFVIDRLVMHQNPGQVTSIRCHRNYLSTLTIHKKEYNETDDDNFHVFRVA